MSFRVNNHRDQAVFSQTQYVGDIGISNGSPASGRDFYGHWDIGTLETVADALNIGRALPVLIHDFSRS